MSGYADKFKSMGSSMKTGASNARNKLTRKNLRKSKLDTLEKIVGRLNKDQFRKLTRSLISLSGGNPDLPQWDEFEPWPSANLQQEKSITRMLDEEMNWMKPCAEKPCKPEELVQTKNDTDGQPMDTPRGAKIAELIAYKSSYAQPCKYECTNIESDGQCAPNGYTDTIGCGDWNSALKGAKIMKSNSGEEVGGVEVDPEEAEETQDSSLGDESINPIIQESSGKGITQGSTPNETADTSKDLFSQINSGKIKTAPAGGRRTRRHKKHSKTKRARKHRRKREGGYSKKKHDKEYGKVVRYS